VTPPPHAGGGDLEVEAGWDEDTNEYVVRAGGVEARDEDAGVLLYQEWLNRYSVELDSSPPTELAQRVRTVLTGAPVPPPVPPPVIEAVVGWDEDTKEYVLSAGGATVGFDEFTGSVLYDRWIDEYQRIHGGSPDSVLELRVQILLGLAPPTEL